MRFSKISLSFGPADQVIFPLDDDVFTSPFVVKSVDGLDPPAVTNRLPQNREIVMMLGLQPNYSLGQGPAELRDTLYGLLSPKLNYPVTFKLLTEGSASLADTTGYISKYEANPFTKDPQVQLVIPCDSPYLALSSVIVPSPGSLSKAPIPITNPGNVSVGFIFKITFTLSASSFSLTNANGSKIFQVNYSFLNGDILTIKSSPQRSVSVLRGAVTTNLLSYITTTSEWLQLHGGLNTFTPSTTNYNLTEVSFDPKLWGV